MPMLCNDVAPMSINKLLLLQFDQQGLSSRSRKFKISKELRIRFLRNVQHSRVRIFEMITPSEKMGLLKISPFVGETADCTAYDALINYHIT